MSRHGSADRNRMAYIVERKDRFYVVTYDGIDPITRRQRKRWHAAEGTAWRTKPSWYVVANNDRTVQPELERFVAKRMNATIYEVESSHVPMLSNPALVLDVIRAAARDV
jgi:pimeloyl-ACP methyl ester carboxylesterase